MKYIIEIEDEPFGRNDDAENPHGMDELYRAKGFKSLVFDQEGLRKLATFDVMLLDDAYQKGLKEAWDMAKKLWLTSMRGGLSCREIDEIFGVDDCSVRDIMEQYSASECISKLKEYEQRKERIEVGDEVVEKLGAQVPFVVTHLWVNNHDEHGVAGFCKGCSSMVAKIEDVRKTGRHFTEIAEVLNKMQEGQDD